MPELHPEILTTRQGEILRTLAPFVTGRLLKELRSSAS
jgi:hypothetical protein